MNHYHLYEINDNSITPLAGAPTLPDGLCELLIDGRSCLGYECDTGIVPDVPDAKGDICLVFRRTSSPGEYTIGHLGYYRDRIDYLETRSDGVWYCEHGAAISPDEDEDEDEDYCEGGGLAYTRIKYGEQGIIEVESNEPVDMTLSALKRLYSSINDMYQSL